MIMTDNNSSNLSQVIVVLILAIALVLCCRYVTSCAQATGGETRNIKLQ